MGSLSQIYYLKNDTTVVAAYVGLHLYESNTLNKEFLPLDV
jgi:hypothetical protein